MAPLSPEAQTGTPAEVRTAAAAPVTAPHGRLGLGIALLLGAVGLFTLMDAAAKHLQQTYPMAQVAWARFAINLALVGMVFRGRFLPLFRTRQPLYQGLRGVMQVGTILLFFFAITHIGLAEADALFEINPVLIVLGAALFLGEKIGPRRIAAIAVAFVGALIILRPGMSAFSLPALLAFLSAFTYTVGNLLTRVVRNDPLATSVIWSAAVGTALTSVLLPFVWQPVAAADFPMFLLVGLLGSAGQVLIIRAFSVAEAGILAPFGYAGLIFAGFWGWLFFDQLPDRWTVTGALVIAGAGLYVWYRERKSA